MHKFDLTADWASGGFEAHLDLQYVTGGEPSAELIGDAQVVSNIEAPEAVRILEAWGAWELARGRAGVKAGLIDLNAEFDVQDVGLLFLNSSQGVGPDLSQTGLNGPSIFPNTSLAVTGFAELGQRWTLRAGVFDGVPGDPDDPTRTLIRLSGEEGALLIAEAEHRFGERAKLKLGGWAYTAEFDAIEDLAPDGSPARLDSNRGAYALVEGRLWSETADPEQGLDAWIRVGFANAEINPIDVYVGGGAVYTGVLKADDQLGLAIGHASFGGPARRAFGLEGAETIAELTYALPVGDTVVVQPDLQYVWNPGGDPTIPNALVVGVRFSLSLSAGLLN
jgi:porin